MRLGLYFPSDVCSSHHRFVRMVGEGHGAGDAELAGKGSHTHAN